MQTRGVSILWAGPDHHTWRYKSILQLLIVKSSSSFYEPICTIHTYMPSRVWALRATWMSYDVIPLDWVIHTWANRGELDEPIIRQDHLHIDACLPGVSYIVWHTYMFSVGETWATHELPRDRSGVSKATRKKSKGCIAFDLTLIVLRY